MKSHWPKKEAEEQKSVWSLGFFFISGRLPVEAVENRLDSRSPGGPPSGLPPNDLSVSPANVGFAPRPTPLVNLGALGQEQNTARQKFTPEQVASQKVWEIFQSGVRSQWNFFSWIWGRFPGPFLREKNSFSECTRFFVQMFNAPECFVWNAIPCALSKRPETFLNYFSNGATYETLEVSWSIINYHE